jgi:hypothetical protein
MFNDSLIQFLLFPFSYTKNTLLTPIHNAFTFCFVSNPKIIS